MFDLPDKRFKVIIKKKGKKRGVSKFFSAQSIEKILEYSLRYVCDRHASSYEDHFIIGEGPKISYIVNDHDHVVIEYKFELGTHINNPIDYYIDMKTDNSGNKTEGGFL